MKYILLFMLVSLSVLTAKEVKTLSGYLVQAVEAVEDAKENTLLSLDIKKTTNSTQEHINKVKVMNTIDKSIAAVETEKAKALSLISQAIHNIDNAKKSKLKTVRDTALYVIIKAVAAVEIAKAKSSETIIRATKMLEFSKQ